MERDALLVREGSHRHRDRDREPGHDRRRGGSIPKVLALLAGGTGTHLAGQRVADQEGGALEARRSRKGTKRPPALSSLGWERRRRVGSTLESDGGARVHARGGGSRYGGSPTRPLGSYPRAEARPLRRLPGAERYASRSRSRSTCDTLRLTVLLGTGVRPRVAWCPVAGDGGGYRRAPTSLAGSVLRTQRGGHALLPGSITAAGPAW